MTIRMDGGTQPRAALDSFAVGASFQIGKIQIQEHELKLLCACLAALVRRTSAGLVIPLVDIEAEYERLSDLSVSLDAAAACVRISVLEAKP